MDRRDIAEKIAREELLEITQRLVRAPSLNPPGDDRECADLVAAILLKEDIAVEKVVATDKLINVVATLEGKGPGKTLLFNGHMDVVPPGSDWTRDPWGGNLVDGKIYGRGASDMKGGIAAMVGSLIALKRAGCPFNGKIVFTAVADEETGSDNGTVFLLEKGLLKADCAVVAEPTGGWVEIGNRGVMWVEFTVRGKACHASRPQAGINAIHNAMKAIDALTRLEFTARQEIFEIPTGSLSATTIGGGTKVNVIPDRCTFQIDRRMVPGESAEQELERLCRTVAGALEEGVDFDTRLVKLWPPVLSDVDGELVCIVMDTVEMVRQRKPGVRAKAGSTDCSFIHAYLGIPIVLYGPGLARLAHCADEYVELSEVVKASHIYTLTVLHLLMRG